MAHPRGLVSRIKGALKAGLGPKLISSMTGVPVGTIREWSVEECQAAVPADDSVADELRDVLLGRFLGRESTR